MSWLKGIVAAFIGGSANVVTVIVIDPIAFNLGEQWKKTLIAAFVGGILAVAGYLKQSPLSGGGGGGNGGGVIGSSVSGKFYSPIIFIGLVGAGFFFWC
jgi:hypothetical protein